MSKATELSVAFVEAQPAAAARVLDEIDLAAAVGFLDDIPESAAATSLAFMQVSRAVALLERLPSGKAAVLLRRTPANARSVLLRAMAQDAREAALATLSSRDRAAMRRHLAYAPVTVGAWMDAPRTAFSADITVSGCLGELRRLGERPGGFVFVVEAGRRLRGVIGIDALLAAEDDALLADLMVRELVTLSPQASLSSVVSSPAWDRSLTLPVVDRAHRLVGVLDFAAVREGLAEERSSARGLEVNVLLIHMVEAFLVCVAGLLKTITVERAPARMANRRGT